MCFKELIMKRRMVLHIQVQGSQIKQRPNWAVWCMPGNSSIRGRERWSSVSSRHPVVHGETLSQKKKNRKREKREKKRKRLERRLFEEMPKEGRESGVSLSTGQARGKALRQKSAENREQEEEAQEHQERRHSGVRAGPGRLRTANMANGFYLSIQQEVTGWF